MIMHMTRQLASDTHKNVTAGSHTGRTGAPQPELENLMLSRGLIAPMGPDTGAPAEVTLTGTLSGHAQRVSLTRDSSSGFGMNISTTCVVLSEVLGGPAQTAGVPIGAKITHVAGVAVSNKPSLIAQLKNVPADTAVDFAFESQHAPGPAPAGHPRPSHPHGGAPTPPATMTSSVVNPLSQSGSQDFVTRVNSHAALEGLGTAQVGA